MAKFNAQTASRHQIVDNPAGGVSFARDDVRKVQREREVDKGFNQL